MGRDREESYLLFQMNFKLDLEVGGGVKTISGRRVLFHWLDANVLFQFCKAV